ncbi:hypothetical protein [Spirabiliibacterium falconis]|uniref:hypothetical protein n=1 Tax=Spirabiliibacterium falconis TaxID=572023 RepID=UPI001AAC4C4D|nr:hypothetical protein [Spirabiliibacterium falconis]MBE2894923.1 hypothetical protein [Spirabiliibacterium falconis]
MENFLAFFAHARRKKPIIGLAQEGETLILSYVDQHKTAHYAQLTTHANSTALCPFDGLTTPLKTCTIVSTLPVDHIWYKAIIMPTSTPATRHQQVLHILHENLPIPVSRLNFDYHITPLQHIGTRRQIDCIEMIACQREHIHQLRQQCHPLPLSAVDYLPFALLRAFIFCLHELASNTLCVYIQDNFCCLLYPQPAQLHHLYHHTIESAVNIWHQRHRENPIDHLVLYCPQHLTFTNPFQVAEIRIDPVQYPHFLALGCALWQGGNHA